MTTQEQEKQSDYELWLILPHTQAFFSLLREEKQTNLEVLSTTESEKDSDKIKGEIRNLNNLLDLNKGEAYVRFDTGRK